ncbi:MAG: PHB depolymerase family esterase [Polyangiales bacterium]
MRTARWLTLLLAGCAGSSADAEPDAATAPRDAPVDRAPVLPSPDVAPTADASADDVAPAPDASPDVAMATCAGRRGAAGAGGVRSLAMGAVTRSYRVYAGRRYDPTRPAMLVINLHGFTSNALQQELYANMPALADARGFVVASPDGLDASWNAGQCCGLSMTRAVDDVGFVRALIDAVSAEYCVDPSRVFATGLSNGGFLSHRLACELSDRIAAVAPVAGVVGVPTCTPARAVPVFQFHGTLDTLVPYQGGGLTGFASVADTMRGWAARDGCGATSTEFLRRGLVHCDRWGGCRDGAEVQLCTVDGGGHTWPGAVPIPAFGLTATDVSASEMMLDFFERHPMPRR